MQRRCSSANFPHGMYSPPPSSFHCRCDTGEESGKTLLPLSTLAGIFVSPTSSFFQRHIRVTDTIPPGPPPPPPPQRDKRILLQHVKWRRKRDGNSLAIVGSPVIFRSLPFPSRPMPPREQKPRRRSGKNDAELRISMRGIRPTHWEFGTRRGLETKRAIKVGESLRCRKA